MLFFADKWTHITDQQTHHPRAKLSKASLAARTLQHGNLTHDKKGDLIQQGKPGQDSVAQHGRNDINQKIQPEQRASNVVFRDQLVDFLVEQKNKYNKKKLDEQIEVPNNFAELRTKDDLDPENGDLDRLYKYVAATVTPAHIESSIIASIKRRIPRHLLSKYPILVGQSIEEIQKHYSETIKSRRFFELHQNIEGMINVH
ncbi:hypothetical protein BKA69DRAFT_406120 [Paraphysoderma sedebokerense]|nr:hypothetical protein BKA69DRAFT_406120 [Paraphysoderma sedebokerense]